MIKSGIIHWKATALIPKARKACSSMPCMTSTSETINSTSQSSLCLSIYWSLLSQCLCRSTEYSHVKTNVVHTLHRVKAVGSQPLESFKDLFTEEEFRRCSQSPHSRKIWFKLTTNVFVAFFFSVIYKLNHSCIIIMFCHYLYFFSDISSSELLAARDCVGL
jgi:hypothetical protein